MVITEICWFHESAIAQITGPAYPVATHHRDRLDIGNAMLRFNTTGITRFADPLLCLEKTSLAEDVDC